MPSSTQPNERAAVTESSAQQGSAMTPVLANYVAMSQGAAQGLTPAMPQVASVAGEVSQQSRQEKAPPTLPREIGGREGPEPTRFGDWEKTGRCIDF
jgi:hypothetical protein